MYSAARAERGVDEQAGRGQDLLGQQGRRQLARELIQAAGVGLALDRDLRLQAQPGGELADQQAHRQQHAEGQQVLHVRHREGRQRLHEEKSNRPTLTTEASAAGPRPCLTATATTASRNSMTILVWCSAGKASADSAVAMAQ